MPITFEKTCMDGVLIVTPHIYSDDRGLYVKYYEEGAFCDNGIFGTFHESSDLYSKKGALRGLHYQTEQSQAKLIHVVSGTLYDVALDLRSGSDTFGKYYATVLRGGENKAIYIPEGFAHGFIALEDETVFSYMCTGKYIPEVCGGIRWDDPELNISWPLEKYGVDSVIVTEKDRNWPTLAEYIVKNHGG